MTTEELFSQCKSNMAKLPDACFAEAEVGVGVVILSRGERSKVPVKTVFPADQLNKALGVSKAQSAAMMFGATFGFHSLLADPDRYTEDGELRDFSSLGPNTPASHVRRLGRTA